MKDWLFAFVKADAPIKSEGTEDNPILRGSRDHSPTKYQCNNCMKWFIEPEYDVYSRDTGNTTFNGAFCSACAAELVEQRWEDLVQRNRKRWYDMIGRK